VPELILKISVVVVIQLFILAGYISDLNASQLPALEPDDYYFNEQGLMVFTEKYHRKRGYCCKNGCKHCPYGYGPKQNKPKQ